MKTILLFFILTVAASCLAQTPVNAPKQLKAIPAANRNSALTPPIGKIVDSPKEINKKKRKLTPVTVTGKPRPQSLSNSK